jgi:hypothetical protein
MDILKLNKQLQKTLRAYLSGKEVQYFNPRINSSQNKFFTTLFLLLILRSHLKKCPVPPQKNYHNCPFTPNYELDNMAFSNALVASVQSRLFHFLCERKKREVRLVKVQKSNLSLNLVFLTTTKQLFSSFSYREQTIKDM